MPVLAPTTTLFVQTETPLETPRTITDEEFRSIETETISLLKGYGPVKADWLVLWLAWEYDLDQILQVLYSPRVKACFCFDEKAGTCFLI